MFKKLDEKFGVEVASFGERNSRMLIFRVGNSEEWEQVADKRVLIIGGAKARQEIKQMLMALGRSSLGNRIPGGLSGSVHTSLREHVGL